MTRAGRRRPGARLERFRIARGAIHDVRPFVVAILAMIPIGFVALPTLLVALGAATSLAFPMGVASMVVSLVALLVFLNLPGKVLVGDDGVFVDTRERRQFIGFGEIDSIERYDEVTVGKRFTGVVLGLHAGADLRLPFGEDQFGASERVAALLSRLREAHAAFRGRAAGYEGTARLAPGEALTPQWAEHLRRVGAGAEAGPRIAPIPGEHLWRVVEDPRADVTARAGAAFALRAQLDEPGRTRLRAVAEATADPALAVALAAAAEEEEAASLEALEAIRVEASTKRPS